MEEHLEQLQYPVGRYTPPDEYIPELQKEWIDVIEVLPRWMDLCIENLDEFQLDTPYRPGGWSVKQVVHHVADSHVNAYIRLKLALTEDTPTINPYNQDLWAKMADIDTVPVNVSVTMLHAIHRRWAQILRNMQPEDWLRTYYHPEHERYITLWEMTDNYVWHSRHHTEHIRRLRERMNW